MAAIVLIVVLVIWGPGKLGDIGSSLGHGLREFRKAGSDVREQLTATTSDTKPASEESTH
jgi:sec-independent protein translocase protein TatA